MSKLFVLLFALILATSSVVLVKPVYSVTQPAVPEFTAELDGDTVVLRIENQPLDEIDGEFDTVRYYIDVKVHTSPDWTRLYDVGLDCPERSDSQYTTLYYSIARPDYYLVGGSEEHAELTVLEYYKVYADLDFQVEALIGNIVEVNTMWGVVVYEFEVSARSGWSETQTVINHNLNPDSLDVRIGSPDYLTYNVDSVPLEVIITGETSWIGYSLDGQNNVTITDNTVNLVGLSHGSHNITVYATEKGGIIKKSCQRYFTVDLITVPATIIELAIVAAIGVVCAIYIRRYLKSRPKRRKFVQSELPVFGG